MTSPAAGSRSRGRGRARCRGCGSGRGRGRASKAPSPEAVPEESPAAADGHGTSSAANASTVPEMAAPDANEAAQGSTKRAGEEPGHPIDVDMLSATDSGLLLQQEAEGGEAYGMVAEDAVLAQEAQVHNQEAVVADASEKAVENVAAEVKEEEVEGDLIVCFLHAGYTMQYEAESARSSS